MNATPDPRVQDFERQLDDALAARPMVRSGGFDTLRLAANIIEVAYGKDPMSGRHLAEGLQILAPTLIGRGPGAQLDIADVVADLGFAAQYHLLRDILYYSYNAPDSMEWTFDKGTIEIRYADASLPRQFFLSANNWFLESMSAFTDEERGRRIEELLQGEPEFEATEKTIEAMALIEAEVDVKLNLYFNLVPDMSVSAGGYTFMEFLTVYRALLVSALYHRYHATLNGTPGYISLPLANLAPDLESSVENVSADTARRVVEDIAYGAEARRARLDPVYFSLYHLLGDDEIIMMPHDFAFWEGIVGFLRLLALRSPELFLRNYSLQIGDALVRRLAKSFEDAGFRVCTNISLTKHNAGLPDIDLLVISEERTLGYAMLLCEVKSPLPPMWAKDQLRVLEADSIAKAFSQLTRINSFIESDDGARFLMEQIPRKGLPDFDEFALALKTMVVTSDNAGAFFAGRGDIIDFRTLERILSRCDGDFLYILNVLKGLPEWADNSLERVMAEVRVGDTIVSYEGVKVKGLMDFGQNAFRSIGAPEQLVSDMLRAGGRPLDVLRERGINFEE